jgi:hypothetical protein
MTSPINPASPTFTISSMRKPVICLARITGPLIQLIVPTGFSDFAAAMIFPE